ncbi:unnamed protein product [Adineta steineri]|uniref:Uncharacterized protein n=1 Tax=Adineta steineri TaxID=433720 RepID=A0A814WMR4_9BILA|nr:unnamed protein product [Adineta steineri]
MNKTSTIKSNLIAEKCRAILRERYCNRTHEYGTFSQQRCLPNTYRHCYSPCNINNLPTPIKCYGKQPYCNTISVNDRCIDVNIAPMKPILNKQTSHIQYLSIPSDNCIQMITNSILNKVRYKISQEEISLLYCCLPSLIRQIMCKSPWLTPNDIIQWLSTDIIKEAMTDFDDNNLPKKSFINDHDNLSLSEDIKSQQSKSILDLPNNTIPKQSKSKALSESQHSFSSQQSDDLQSNTYSSIRLPLRDNKNNQENEKNTIKSKNIESDSSMNTINSKNIKSDLSIDTINSKDIGSGRKLQIKNQSAPVRIEYPGTKDPKTIENVKQCLDFYHKIREYFDDDVAAMLLKCCLCYGDCSGKR